MADSAIKTCTKCGETKPLTEFRYGQCKTCARERNREYQRRYYQANREAERERRRRYHEASREKILEYQRQYNEAHRAELNEAQRQRCDAAREAVFDHYGRVCACCGSTENPTLDHVNGDGTAHRKKLFNRRTSAGATFYRWLVKNNFPPDPPLQVLCLPCNNSKNDGERCRLTH